MKLQECKFGCLLGILLSLLATHNSTQAQVYKPDFTWATGAYSTGEGQYVVSDAIVVDLFGNSFVSGRCGGMAVFGPTTLTNGGGFLAKFDPQGRVLWAREAYGRDEGEEGFSIATDAGGNAYVTGKTFTQDIFVAKYTSGGDLLWRRRSGSEVLDYGSGIAVDRSGNAFVTGVMHLTPTFGGHPETDPKLQKIYIAKYSPAGELLWEKRIGGNQLNEGKGIGVDGAGNVYVTGHFWNTNLFGPNTISGYGSFLAKYDGAGNLLWVTKTGENGGVEGMAVDDQGNSFLAGYFVATITFGTNSLINTNHDTLGFVVKYDTSGNALWAKSILVSSPGTGDSDYRYVLPQRIAVDTSGNWYLTGNFKNIAIFGTIQIADYSTAHGYSANPDGFLAKGDPNGNFLWARDVGRLGNDAGTGIAVDAQGNAYLTGMFGGMITLGKTILQTWNSGMFVTQMPAFFLTSPILNQTTGKLEFVLAAQRGRECAIEYSTDLVHWLALATNQIPAAGFLELNYSVLSGVDRGFYRARSVSP